MSDDQITPEPVARKKPGRKPKIAPVESAAAPVEPLPVAAKPAIQVTTRRNEALMRRLAGGNPFASGTRAIPLKEPHRWHLRIENDYADDGQVYRAIHEGGWVPLEPGDLACAPIDVGLRIGEGGYLVRGAQGREVVLKMAKEDYRQLELAKTAANNATIGRPDKIKAEMAGSAAATHGAEAGDFVHRHVTGTVTDTQRVIPQ